ncbi:PHB depolymerase family esterase [Kutzneria buriramensis]|uniref:Poly(Hydroxyalkanoate) depolymerase family esterase n=1 Tax=Kutzneria buriramensis TaxID=1045776 RepID=A0A3E0GU78_9PSEU|nr:PHB depolymerase family esterase [Kutzneria buriramensis]REH27768.1 poly(hydroxyalkanoate) depolymerase family esterase [Kutzneria buriramensis]
MRPFVKAFAGICSGAVIVAACAMAASAPRASAATLTQVTDFGPNPGNLQMYSYVPASAPAHPAIVLALHPCGGSGPQFYSGSEFAGLADRYGFVVVYPSATHMYNCFDSWSAQAKVRGGGSDPVSLMSMVTYAERAYHGDPDRVYVTGSSGGAMETNIMLGDYPDVFKAGAAFMGVPFGCFVDASDYIPSPGASNCASGRINKTPQQWGDLARAGDPGYTGPRPRVQLWHGTADNLVYYAELQQEIDQWTNVFGLGRTPTSTDTPQSGWTRWRFADSAGKVDVEAYSIAGAGHVLPSTGMAGYAIHFFGLDSGTPPPTTTTPGAPAACRVTDAISSWSGGMTENITISNTGSAAITGWSLAFTLPAGQAITSGWSAAYSPTSGQVTATNLGYNATIPAGGSTSIGFQASQTGDTAAPAGFTLNGAACATG